MYFKYFVLFICVVINNTYTYQYGYGRPTNYWDWNNYNINTNEILRYRNSEKVKVQIYYECLCPDCIRFDTQQLAPAVKKMGSFLDLHTYPYGNAETHNDGRGHIQFTCQHGPKECYGNMLHACAIAAIGNATTSVIYNTCLMETESKGGGSNDQGADMCGSYLGIDSAPIKACAKGPLGTMLLKYYGDESKRVGFQSVPYILVNGAETQEENFMQTVCRAFTNPPPQCQEYL